MARPSREDLKKEDRPVRVPVHEANRNKLTVPGLDTDNFEHRWVNNVESRLGMFLEGGWEFVNKTDTTKVGEGGVDQSAGVVTQITKGVGGGIVAYLMRIPKEFYTEDQAKKQLELDRLDADIKRSVERDFKGRLTVGSHVTGKPII